MSDDSRKHRKKSGSEALDEMERGDPKPVDRRNVVRPTIETKVSNQWCPECGELLMLHIERFGREVGEVRYYCNNCLYEEVDFGEDALSG